MAPPKSSIADIKKALSDIQKLADSALKNSKTTKDFESLRVDFLGKKGHLSAILKQMGRLDPADRPKVGQLANALRDKILALIDEGKENLAGVALSMEIKKSIDVTLPGRRKPKGTRHPISIASDRILQILAELGFDKAIGPEVEHDFYNFEALNIPKNHPARDMQDTFYISDDVVMRTHTSPVQIRSMLAIEELPIRIASYGRVYRKDHDVTHSPMFHQVEGLYVAEKVSFADLKGVLEVFICRLFGEDAKMRLRPSFFPFTEPSVEVDMTCFLCKGSGCHLCKKTGWIEIMGAGMVDPEVLKAAQIDPEKYTGFAFGVGVERVAMLMYGITDIRLFFENDSRFLAQF